MRVFFFVLLYTISFLTRSQNSPNNNPFQNPVILKHYTVQDLQYLQQYDSLKLKTIVYYYTQSFYFENKECNQCIPVSIYDFDITEYEYLRQKNKTYVRHFEKYGFKLRLIPINELEYKLPIHYTK